MQPPVSRFATLFSVCVAHFLMPFMMSAVAVSLPVIGREFGASALQLGLVETTYVLSASIFLLAMGRLGDIHGRRRVFEFGIAVFTLAGGLLSQAWSVETVIAFRFLQGMGGAMVMGTTMAIVVSAFPAEERGKALGIAVASVYAGISCGPFLGGALVTAYGWRVLFILSVPLGIATFLTIRKKIHGDWAEAAGEPFDWKGSLIYGVALLLLIVGASRLDHGLWAWGVAASGIAGLCLFAVYESRVQYPILNVGLLRENRIFALSNLAALFNYAATFGVTFFLSLYLQYVKGMNPREAGSVLIIQPVVQTLFSPFCGRLADRFPAPFVATTGMALCAVGLGTAATLTASSSLVHVMVMLGFLGMGFALFSSPNTSVIMGSVPPHYLGVATGLSSTMRTLGMMTSMTIITVIFSIFMGDQTVTSETRSLFLLSMRTALWIFSALCGAGIFCSIGRLRVAGQNPK